MQTYILFNNTRDRKHSVNWHTFKKDVFPLASDSNRRNGKEISDKQISGTMTPQQFNDWLKGKKPVDLEIIKEE